MVKKTKAKKKKVNSKKKQIKSLRKSKLKLIIESGVFFITILIIGLYAFISSNKIFAANFADNILRPIFGSQLTISSEAAFFNIEDKFNQIKYFFIKKNTQDLNSNLVKNTKINYKFELKNITPLSDLPKADNEGVWKQINIATMDGLMAETFLRPDQEKPYAVAYLVKMNMDKLFLSAVAGIVEPGGFYNSGPGKIPQEHQLKNSLVAAFNGGFQKKDGEYGMIVGNKVYLPLKKNLATLVLYKNQKPKIINYTGQDLRKDVIAVRQNGPMLLENSKDVSSAPDWNIQTWGLTTTNSMYTWRSGIGVTKEGDLIYAAGPSLIPQTLSLALKKAGAVSAMQLDINPVWVRFVIFSYLNGRYNYSPLLNDMVNGGYEYLNGYQKDFFYLKLK